MSDIAIKIEGVSKRYRIGQHDQYKTMRDSLTQFFKNPRGYARYHWVHRDDDLFWALRDITLQIGHGEVIGIIGRNGAGKSTLLKILSRITSPTTGRIEIKGRVGSLLEVGTGFHPELSGRENIYLNGAILGMRRGEIEAKFDEIVAFSEIEKFLETPVKRYSSGMYMRLAFAVAAHLEPEILVIDEVLAVGDAAFQKKCLGKMGDVARQGRTVLFVSHNMAAINRLCARAFWLERGQLLGSGTPGEMISRYLASECSETGEAAWPEGIANRGVTEVSLLAARILNEDGAVAPKVDVRKQFYFEMRYRINQILPYARVGFDVRTADGMLLFESYDIDAEDNTERREIGEYAFRCEVPGNLLNPGTYSVGINIGIPHIKNLVRLEGVLSLVIEDTGAVGQTMNLVRAGVIRPKLKWEKVS
jgi:lipopolysaccharide transport system ATP-binding protein